MEEGGKLLSRVLLQEWTSMRAAVKSKKREGNAKEFCKEDVGGIMSNLLDEKKKSRGRRQKSLKTTPCVGTPIQFERRRMARWVAIGVTASY